MSVGGLEQQQFGPDKETDFLPSIWLLAVRLNLGLGPKALVYDFNI